MHAEPPTVRLPMEDPPRRPGDRKRYGFSTFPRSHANATRSTRLPILSRIISTERLSVGSTNTAACSVAPRSDACGGFGLERLPGRGNRNWLATWCLKAWGRHHFVNEFIRLADVLLNYLTIVVIVS